jgi:long-chain fatty acid transport protein
MRIYGVRSVIGTHESVMINPRGILRFLALMISGALALKASANGFRLPDQDAFATARGEAFVATADNPSAIYYNPAGITQLEGNNLRGGLYGIYLDSYFTPPSSAPNHGHTYDNQDNYAVVPQVFYTYTPTNMLIPVSFGLGVYAPYGGKSSWPQDTGFRSVALDGSLTYLTINPVVAVKLPFNFSIGGGVMVNYANMDWDQGLTKYQLPSTNFFHFTGNGWSVGYNLGLLWQPQEKVSIGASFRSSTTVTLDGQTSVERLPTTPKTNQTSQTDFKFPFTVVCGISYRPTPKWNIEFDADYTDWSSFGSSTIRQATPPPNFPSDAYLKLYWQPSWMYEFGVTRYFDSGWRASAGFVYNENSVPNTYYTPIVADMDRYFLSAGTGYQGKHFNFDIAYQFGYGPTHTVIGSQPASIPPVSTGQKANGKYDFNSQAVSVSVGWRF